jgi:division/cell wall cluster transcriptional repressor MraZ
MASNGGYAEVTLDEKGRTTLNYTLRGFFLDGGMLAVVPEKGCLAYYQKEAWQRYVLDYVKTLSIADPKARRVMRFLAQAVPVSAPDEQGRVVFPAFPREKAGMGKKLVIYASGDRALIYDEVTDQKLPDELQAPEEIQSLLLDMGWGGLEHEMPLYDEDE